MGKVQTIARRRKRADLGKYLSLLKMILLAAFLIYALFFFSQSSLFSIQEIAVSGQKHLASGEVSRESGLSDGMNIFRVNLDQAEKRLQTDPWIENSRLQRRLPDKIQITITERQPSAILITGQRWLVLDRNGFCIDSVSSLHAYNLPIITGIKTDAVEPGKQIGASPALLALLTALDLSVEDFYSEVDISNPENLVAYTRDTVPVYLGMPKDLHAKLAAGQSLLVGFSDPGAVAYVDLRSVQAPAVKYQAGANSRVKKS